ncbi:MAG: hypothetical protein LBR91_04045 [Puniceicoccales bacterium]|nr:hypothetical protein [Puniceicoccales bacterium]
MLGTRNKKLIFAIVVAMLGLTVALFVFVRGRGNSSTINYGDGDPSHDSDSKKLLKFTKKNIEWIQPLKEGDGPGDFDLFTGPYAYVENGKIVTKSYDILVIDDAFPLYLAEIKPKPYRLKVEGYSRVKNSNLVIVMFHDIESNKYGECQVNDRNDELRLRVKNVEIKEKEVDGVIFEVPYATIYDEVAKKEFTVSNKREFVDGEYIVVIKDIGGNEYIFRDVGGTVKIGEASCTLHSFSKNDGTARLLLKDAHGQEFNKIIHLMR